MQTRYTQLVKYKKNEMQKCERELHQAHYELQYAQENLERSYELLNTLKTPNTGQVSTFLQSRESLSLQRSIIVKESQDVAIKTQVVAKSKEILKRAMVEYEKFKYLETEQIKKMMKKRNMAEAKYLDEAALQTFIGHKA